VSSTSYLPLFPLPNVVHFPGTDLKLHVFEPRYRKLVRDLLEAAPESRLVGMVLMKPGASKQGVPEVFPGGTAGLMVDVELLPDGRSNILLHGDFRFEIEHEIDANPYRRAMVRQLAEPQLAEDDAGILTVRRGLLELIGALAAEIGDGFPLRKEHFGEAAETLPFELLVNRIAAEIDLPAMTKIQLLNDALPERAVSLLDILRHSRQVLDVLRPFRHLATDSELN
jgi:Lon protease-like protein